MSRARGPAPVAVLAGVVLVVGSYVVESSVLWTLGAVAVLAGAITWLWARRT